MVICEDNGYNAPQIYQGMYNLISRKVEEIFPLLKENDIEFWGYNPLAGGLLTGKYKTNEIKEKETNTNVKETNTNTNTKETKNNIIMNSRFKNNLIYQNIFWKEEILTHLFDFFEDGNCIEKSYSWLQNCALLKENDKIIIGASSNQQLESNLEIIKKNQNQYKDSKTFIYEPIKEFSPNYYY